MGLDRLVPFVALILALVSPAASADPPELPRGKGDACVAPTDEMRRDHMDFLLHQRDLTVHDGIRTPRFSLVECVDCHVQRNSEGGFIPVDAPEQFCEICHTYASVKMDCFGCHATTPDSASADAKTAASVVHTGDVLGVMSYRVTPVPEGGGTDAD
ncbi:MAG: Hdr-like menaquinol oxidoreductase cytochrome c subunit [Gammaproteobacteria bacterium]|nr:Hdr-like menaquinol oxidoreductase cytochrome c subunit [Gammaproteobacteria bacterium]